MFTYLIAAIVSGVFGFMICALLCAGKMADMRAQMLREDRLAD